MSVDFATCELSAEEVLGRGKGNRVFEAVLAGVTSAALPFVLGRYIQFNSVFGAGVAGLAGQIGVRQELFRDPGEECAPLADRSCEVAAEIFYAAIDEFGDHTGSRRGTHRSIAQATLRGVSEFVGCGTAEMNAAGFVNPGTWEAIEGVREGYGLRGPVSDERLLRAIGFHVASETLADREFCLLDEQLRRRFPDMVRWLEAASIAVGGASFPGYLWVRIHTTAEAEHSLAAFTAVDKAVRYYAGPGGRERAFGWIRDGVDEFAALQNDFMNQLAG